MTVNASPRKSSGDKKNSQAAQVGLSFLLALSLLLPYLAEIPPFKPQTAAQETGTKAAGVQETAPIPLAQEPAIQLSEPGVRELNSPVEILDRNAAFVSDLALAGGDRQWTLSSTPFQYPAEDGTWQPIEAQFRTVEGGFVNDTNLLQISAGDRTAALRLLHGNTAIGWEPEALVLTSADGKETTLAHILAQENAAPGTLVANGETIRYAGSWTLPDLWEQITAGPGRVEQTLIVNQPLLAGAAPANQGELAFRATLHLLPGAVLTVEGEKQAGAFTTAGPVEIRDTGGEVALVLDPIIAYEQDHPSLRVAGHFAFTPRGGGEWQVAVVTPWSWWAAPARRYPVVLDPTMKVKSPLTTAMIYNNYPDPCPYAGYVLPSGVPAIGVGYDKDCGALRSLIRFDSLPTLPPEYVIEKAELLIGPEWGLAENVVHLQTGSGVEPVPVAQVSASIYKVTSSWNPSTNWNNKPSTSSLPGSVTIFYTDKPAQASEPYYVGRYTLQDGPDGLVTDWLLASNQNFGLAISDGAYDDEDGCVLISSTGQPLNQYACEAVFVPTISNWTKADIQNLDPETASDSAESGGFMLQITYTPPLLPLDEPQFIEPLPSFDANFADNQHAYRAPNSTSTWTGIGVKGLDVVQNGADVLLHSAGNLRLRAYKDCAGVTIPSQGDLAGKPNYFLVRGNPATCGVEAWVDPPNPDAAENANLDDYGIQAIPSENLPGNPTFSASTWVTETVVISTTDILKVMNLNLVNDTRVGVQVEATAYHPDIGSFGMPFIGAQVFSPVAASSVVIRDFHGQDVGGYTQLGVPPMGSFEVETGQGGTWALALDYFGDVHPVLEDPPITSTVPLSVTLQVSILSCPLDGIPTEDGCVIISKPEITTPFMDVGPYRIFSEAGFNCSGSACVTKKRANPGDPLYAPFIVWTSDWLGGQQDRLVAVVGAPIFFNTAGNGSLDTNGNLWMVHCPPNPSDPPDLLQITAQAFTVGLTNPADSNYGRLVPSSFAMYANLPLASGDAAGTLIKINVDTQTAEASTPISRNVLTEPGTPLDTFNFALSWHVQAEGYAATLSNKTLTPLTIPADADVGSLTLLFGTAWDMDYRDASMGFKPNGRFSEIRNWAGYAGDGGAGAKITAPPDLGSKWKGVTAMILPVGVTLPEEDNQCTGACLDLRAPDDTPNAPNRVWEMPDLTVTGQANTLFFNAPGELTVFSTEHPNAQNAVTVPFSFRTFEGDVSVEMKACPVGGSAEIVPVITGETKISLPGLGSDSNPGNMIGATFILCETALRKTAMTFDAPPLPEIPVGNTGILVNHLKGEVLIGPDNTQIKFTLNFHDASDAVDGEATVTLNTEGLFDIQAEGEVLAAVDYNGHAWVAWNPLDVGIDIEAWYSSWLHGQVKAHMWKGQGWQNKYNWLPDDGRTHITGSIAADIVIEKGQAFSWWFVDIPPFTVSFGITVEFGEFCVKGTGCQKQEWGVKGKFSIIGYDVGFFYGFKSGFDFILGSDGHKLIDQYGTATAAGQALIDSGAVAGDPLVGGNPVPFARETVPNPNASTVTAPFTVSPFAGSFIAGLSWIGGSPHLALVNPNGQEINVANANGFGIMTSDSITHTLYGVSDPLAGTWQMKITNAAPVNDYHFIYLANKEAPDVDLLTPATDVTIPANETTYSLQWSVPGNPPPGVDLRMSLYYTVTNTTALTDTQTYGGTIRENLPLTDGSYNWDLFSLAYGDYQVYAKVYDGMAGNDSIQPSPTVTGTNQIPGAFWIEAPGVIHLQDFVAPAVPAGLGLVPIQNGFLACWAHNTEKDLSGYVIRHLFPDVSGNPVQRDLRVHAQIVQPNNWMQCARLGGFNDGEQVMAQIAAYDASGNLSGFSDIVEDTVSVEYPSVAPTPSGLTTTYTGPGQVTLAWTPLDLPPGGGYLVHWVRQIPQGLGQVEEPIFIDSTQFSITLNLDPGFVYFFVLQSRDDWARLSQPSNRAYLLLSDGIDDDGDGLPDDWEAAYEVSLPQYDPDGDGLTNVDELGLLTDPRRFDTDGDGFSDGTEVVGGSDPLDLSSTPATYDNFASGLLPLPMLFVDKYRLSFYAYTGSGETSPQTVGVFNIGGGTLNPIVSDDASWLTTSLNGNTLTVNINKTGLASGYYSALIQVAGAPGSTTQNSPKWIPVDLWVFEGDKPLGNKIYLPVVVR